jgi:hypothetical protein
MRRGTGLVVAVAASVAGGAAMAQDMCGDFPVGEASYACACPGGFSQGSVWGSGPYTGDSDVCTAALHAGVIGPDGGKVLATAAEGQQSYTGSMVNGVTTRDWGSYPNSFVFAAAVAATGDVAACDGYPEDAESLTCGCDAAVSDGSGFVWGSSPYSGDSDICTAALHGGLIGPEGGVVTALRTAGLESYLGSEINGVETFDWSGYSYSFVFDYNQ